MKNISEPKHCAFSWCAIISDHMPDCNLCKYLYLHNCEPENSGGGKKFSETPCRKYFLPKPAGIWGNAQYYLKLYRAENLWFVRNKRMTYLRNQKTRTGLCGAYKRLLCDYRVRKLYCKAVCLWWSGKSGSDRLFLWKHRWRAGDHRERLAGSGAWKNHGPLSAGSGIISIFPVWGKYPSNCQEAGAFWLRRLGGAVSFYGSL